MASIALTSFKEKTETDSLLEKDVIDIEDAKKNSHIINKSTNETSIIPAIMSSLLYSGCAVAMVLANKAIAVTVPLEDRHKLPQTGIILSQCIIAVWLVEGARLFGIIEYPGLETNLVKQWLPLNILFIAMIFTGFLSLVYVSVPMVTIFKNITNLFTVFGDWYLFNEPASNLAILSIVIMTVGAILAGVNDLEFNLVGYIWMILNCFATSGYVLYMRYASSNIKLSKFGMVYYNNLLSSIILFPIFLLRGEMQALRNPVFYNPAFVASNLVAGFLGFYLNFASLWCVAATSATTFAILGSINKVPILILGGVLFNAKMTYEGVIFIVMATLGGFIFAYDKLPKNNK